MNKKILHITAALACVGLALPVLGERESQRPQGQNQNQANFRSTEDLRKSSDKVELQDEDKWERNRTWPAADRIHAAEENEKDYVVTGYYVYDVPDRYVERVRDRRDAKLRSSQDRRDTRALERIDTRTLSGQLQGFRAIRVKNRAGVEETHVLARVRTDRGRFMLVDLGERENLDTSVLRLGEEITIRGRKGTLDKRTVVVAGAYTTPEKLQRASRTNVASTARSRPADRGIERKADPREARSFAQQERTMIRGQIDGFRTVDFQTREGRLERHQFVRLRFQDGDRAVVALGPETRKLRSLDLKEGDTLVVKGDRQIVDGEEIIVAERVSVSPHSTLLKQKNKAFRNEQAALQRLEGKVDGFRQVRLKDIDGEPADHTLVRLNLEDGRSTIIGLGETRELSDLDLSVGDRIQIEGTTSEIDGRSVLMAERILIASTGN